MNRPSAALLACIALSMPTWAGTDTAPAAVDGPAATVTTPATEARAAKPDGGKKSAAPASDVNKDSKADIDAKRVADAKDIPKPAPKGGKPGALREHLNMLKRALPPSVIEGPGSAGDGGFVQRANATA